MTRKSCAVGMRNAIVKAAKYEIQKPSTCCATLFRCKFSSMFSRFSPCVINLTRNKNICCRLKKCGALIGWFARARANLLRDKLWIWWKTSNKAKICCSKKIRALLFATTFFNPQQMFLLRDKLSTQGEKRETSTKTCNETMLRNKLKVFVSRISPP